MTPEEIEQAAGKPLQRADLPGDDCEAWSLSGVPSLRIMFWDRRAVVLEVSGSGFETVDGIRLGDAADKVLQKLEAAKLQRVPAVLDFDFPIEVRSRDQAREELSMAFELVSGRVAAILVGESTLVRSCTFVRRLRLTSSKTNHQIAVEQGLPSGYEREGATLPAATRIALTEALGIWRLALPSQGDVDRCFSGAGHPAWVQGDFDGDGRLDVAVQVTSFGRGGLYLVLNSGTIVELETFVGSGGGVIQLLKSGEIVGPIDEPPFTLKSDAVLAINCEKSAVVYVLEPSHKASKHWISD
jgi:hypothetical protein